MNESDIYYFNLLKKEVATTFLKNYTASNIIKDWKGEDITAFQEDLFAKVKGRVSEKWFYTYFKNTTEKLPRIDMLNLLSNYIGLKNWNAFKAKNSVELKKSSGKKYYKILFAIFIILCIMVCFLNQKEHQFKFCFVDALKNESITKTQLEIKVLTKNESPLYFKTDEFGCFTYTTKEDQITFVVQSPYHKTDTIIRHIKSNKNTTVKITPDDYALLLEYYANGNIKNRTKHKKQLNELIDNSAAIYQFFGNNIGIELYTKQDFIRFTTLPTTTVKHIKILEKKMKNGKIVKLKFIAK